MKRISFLLAAVLLVAGCALFPGRIEEGLPKLREKLPDDAKVYLACPLNPRGAALYTRNAKMVIEEFARALRARGNEPVLPERRSAAQEDVLAKATEEKCDVVIFAQILSWEYGDDGLTGRGGRDEVTLSVMLMDPEKRRVLARATLYIANGIGRSPVGGEDDPAAAISPIVRRYVDSLFAEKKDTP